jgi:hypothetical protein
MVFGLPIDHSFIRQYCLFSFIMTRTTTLNGCFCFVILFRVIIRAIKRLPQGTPQTTRHLGVYICGVAFPRTSGFVSTPPSLSSICPFSGAFLSMFSYKESSFMPFLEPDRTRPPSPAPTTLSSHATPPNAPCSSHHPPHASELFREGTRRRPQH